MATDISGLSYFAPILAFLIVAVVIFAVLNKTKLLGESAWGNAIVALIIATVFVSAAGVRDYVLTITPWFAALLVSLFFILFFIGFIGKPIEGMTKGMGILFVVLLLVVFLISGFVVFSDVIQPFLPGGTKAGGFKEIYNSRVFGGVLLLAVGIGVLWILVKSGVKKED